MQNSLLLFLFFFCGKLSFFLILMSIFPFPEFAEHIRVGFRSTQTFSTTVVASGAGVLGFASAALAPVVLARGAVVLAGVALLAGAAAGEAAAAGALSMVLERRVLRISWEVFCSLKPLFITVASKYVVQNIWL